jgi:hypothetical protein
VVYYRPCHYANRPPNEEPQQEETIFSGDVEKTVNLNSEVRIMDQKKWWKSGTFWGAVAGAVASIANGVAAFKAGDTAKVGESIMATIGFWTAWRLRKGQGVAIADPAA